MEDKHSPHLVAAVFRLGEITVSGASGVWCHRGLKEADSGSAGNCGRQRTLELYICLVCLCLFCLSVVLFHSCAGL